MAQRDPIEWRGSDEPVIVRPSAQRKAPLQFPRPEGAPIVSLWRTCFYFLLLVIFLAGITYLIVRPR